jgi:glucan-binding YG repeat protein
MVTGWQKIGGKWYFFESSGAMLANTSRKIGGKTYKFNASGVCTNP